MKRTCQACGFPNKQEDKFCFHCGMALKKVENRSKVMKSPSKPSSHPPTARPPSRPSSRSTPYQHYPNYYPDYYGPRYPYDYYSQYYYYYPRAPPPSDFTSVLAGLVILPSFVFIGIVLFLNIISLIIGLGIVFPNILTENASIILIYPWPNFVYPVTISGLMLSSWYLFIIIGIIISIFWLFKTEGKEFFEILKASGRKLHPPPFKSDNSIIIIAQFFFALLFLNLAITIILTLLGIPIQIPEIDSEPALWEPLFYLANASVAEEIFTRIVYIGLPLLAFDFLVRKRTEKLHKYFIGGGFKLEHITISLIIISSILFGLAHYPSWGLWKILPTFIAGLAFGYLFVRKGIHTAIILHFLIDYMYIIILIFSGNFVLLLFVVLSLGLVMLFWLSAGAIYTTLYISEFFRMLVDRILGSKGKPEVASAADAKLPARPSYPPEYDTSSRAFHARYPDMAWPPPYSRVYYDWYREQYHRSRAPSPPARAKPGAQEDKWRKNCPYCKNEVIYYPDIDYWYCERCMRYVYFS